MAGMDCSDLLDSGMLLSGQNSSTNVSRSPSVTSQSSSCSKSYSIGVELKFLEKSKRKLTKAAVGARFYKILDILMEIVGMELGPTESQAFLDAAIMMGISIGFHVKLSDFPADAVKEMRQQAHQLAMMVSHYQKMSFVYDCESLLEHIDRLRQFTHTAGVKVLDESTHKRLDKVVSFFTESILNRMFEDGEAYNAATQRLMELLDALIEEGQL